MDVPNGTVRNRNGRTVRYPIVLYRTVRYRTVRLAWRLACLYGTITVRFRTTVPYRTKQRVQHTAPYVTYRYVPSRTVRCQSVPYITNTVIRYSTVPYCVVRYGTVTEVAQCRIRTNTVSSQQFEPAIQTVDVRKRSCRLVYKGSGTTLLHSCLIIILPGACVPHLCDEPCGSAWLRPSGITTFKSNF